MISTAIRLIVLLGVRGCFFIFGFECFIFGLVCIGG
jgi:hypothetical protein